jgi:hypothetical protein
MHHKAFAFAREDPKSMMRTLSLILFIWIGILSAGSLSAQEGNSGGKKNARPAGKTVEVVHGNDDGPSNAGPVTHIYEFTRPGFTYELVRIEHDDKGLGKISFRKDGSDELITDPIRLSQPTSAKLRNILDELDFVNSKEDYQYENDYSHLGNISITVRRDGRERTAKYNWTLNKHAKELSDEYRRITNEYTWLFEFGIARQNQPLRTPGMMDALDGYLRRNEIPDPIHLVPFLDKLSTDERLPLIARNHALKLAKSIRKSAK